MLLQFPGAEGPVCIEAASVNAAPRNCLTKGESLKISAPGEGQEKDNWGATAGIQGPDGGGAAQQALSGVFLCLCLVSKSHQCLAYFVDE